MKNCKRSKASETFKQAIKEFSQKTGTPHYQIAAQAKVTPSIISNILNDSQFFYTDDPRIQRISRVIKFRKECFAE